MTLEIYTTITRYFTCFVFSFFTYQFLMSLFNYSKHMIRSSLWHSLMCFSTALYCFVFALNTHFFMQELSDGLLTVFWILAYTSYFCYLQAIEAYLKKDIALLIPSKVYCLFLVACHMLNAFSFFLFGKNLLFEKNVNQVTLFSQTMNFTISPNLFTLGLGAVGAIVVFYSSAVIWNELGHRPKNEKLLKGGIVVSVLSVLNDSALGLELAGGLIPLYYLGNAFEAVRLNLHYQNLAYDKINKLEGEVDQLSQVAQFGYAAANVSHDIKNHLMIVKYCLKSLSVRYDKNKVEKSLKYINQINDITHLYTGLFKYNNELKFDQYNVKKIALDAIELLKDRIEKAKIELTLDIPENIEIRANDIALTLCLVNLIGNSIDEIASTKAPWIKIIFDHEEKCLKIIDSGPGIPAEIANSIFEVNYSTKKDKGGSGLGLAISRQLILKSGLELKLDQLAKNTTFVIELSA